MQTYTNFSSGSVSFTVRLTLIISVVKRTKHLLRQYFTAMTNLIKDLRSAHTFASQGSNETPV